MIKINKKFEKRGLLLITTESCATLLHGKYHKEKNERAPNSRITD